MAGTELQKNAVKELVENGRNKGKALVRAGYSKNTAIAPTKVTESKGFKEELQPFIRKLEAERDRLIQAISEKDIGKVDYEKAVSSFDKIVKNIELLSGRPTENIQTPYESNQFNDIAKRITRRNRDGESDGKEGTD